MEGALKPLKWYKSLNTRKGRLEGGAFIVEGRRAVDQIVTGHPEAVMELLSVSKLPERYDGFSTRLVEEHQFKSISGATTPQGIMAVVKAPDGIETDELPEQPGRRVLLLEDVQDPGNTGTLIRTAAALGFSGVILTDRCADPLSPKCVQSTAGSVLSVWIRRTNNYIALVERLKTDRFTHAAAILDGKEDLSPLADSDKLLLSLGNEASGLSAAVIGLADLRVRIPIDTGKAESLNVAASGAILMYLSFGQH